MVNPIAQHLSIEICTDATEAVARGFNWSDPAKNVKPIEVKKVVVVQYGTQAAQPTVDFLLEDETGQQFVFMVTGALLRSIPTK